MQSVDSSDHHGGAASADRQCQFTKSDGFRCRDWALRGHQHCFRHHQYLQGRPETPIDVPLLEDEDSLTSLLSQTLRALAWGTISAANGRAILAGCRIMQGTLSHRLAMGKFHAKLLRLGMAGLEAELFDREPIPTPEPEPVTSNPQPVPSHPSPGTSRPSPVTRNPQPVTRNPSPMTRYPDLDRDQTLEPFRVSQAVPCAASTVEELVAAMGH